MGLAAIIIHVVSERATTTAILENDIVKTDKQEKSLRRPRGSLRGRPSESEQKTVRFLRETTQSIERNRDAL